MTASVVTLEAAKTEREGAWTSRIFLALSVLAVVPLWLVERPPLQDLPQHLGTLRVLMDHAEPALRLSDAVQVHLEKTQYLAFYLVAWALAKVVGILVATKLLLSLSLIAIPYATRSLLRALDKDERLALFVLPLTYNAHVILGFLNYLAAIPLAIAALALGVRQRAQPTLARGIGLALLLVALFYMHVVPCAFAMLGVALVSIDRQPKQSLLRALALMPAAGCAAIWSLRSPAGESTSEAIRGALRGETSGLTRFDPFEKTLRELPEWVTDVLRGDADLTLLWLWLGVVVAASLFARGAPRELAQRGTARRLWLLPLLAGLFAFVMPYQHAWIWPIAGRFPYLSLVLLPVMLPDMKARAGRIVVAALASLTLAQVALTGQAFWHFQQEEVRGFPGALASIPTGARVLGLIYDNESQYVGQHPFMHYVAYSQAEHGGVVAFSFADTQQSPFKYVAPGGPPAIRLGFGWAPQAANMRQAATYFEYALARGEHPHLRSVAQFYEKLYADNGWSVWRRRKAP